MVLGPQCCAQWIHHSPGSPAGLCTCPIWLAILPSFHPVSDPLEPRLTMSLLVSIPQTPCGLTCNSWVSTSTEKRSFTDISWINTSVFPASLDMIDGTPESHTSFFSKSHPATHRALFPGHPIWIGWGSLNSSSADSSLLPTPSSVYLSPLMFYYIRMKKSGWTFNTLPRKILS